MLPDQTGIIWEMLKGSSKCVWNIQKCLFEFIHSATFLCSGNTQTLPCDFRDTAWMGLVYSLVRLIALLHTLAPSTQVLKRAKNMPCSVHPQDQCVGAFLQLRCPSWTLHGSFLLRSQLKCHYCLMYPHVLLITVTLQSFLHIHNL